MSLRRLLLPAMGALALLAACGKDEPPPPLSPPPPPPTIVSLTLEAAAEVNPDAAGAAKPLRVRVLELADGNAFSRADFFALDQDPAKALGGDLVGSEELVLAPGATRIWQARLDDKVRVIGVVAAYRAIDRARWRAWKEIPPHATTLLVADLGASGVALREDTP